MAVRLVLASDREDHALLESILNETTDIEELKAVEAEGDAIWMRRIQSAADALDIVMPDGWMEAK